MSLKLGHGKDQHFPSHRLPRHKRTVPHSSRCDEWERSILNSPTNAVSPRAQPTSFGSPMECVPEGRKENSPGWSATRVTLGTSPPACFPSPVAAAESSLTPAQIHRAPISANYQTVQVILPPMKRALYIAGLTLSLVVFGGFAAMAAWGGITHRHLNIKGWMMLIGNPYICWMVAVELRKQFRARQE